MPIEDEVRRIADLAHIEMDEELARRLVPQIATILGYVAAVARLDVGNFAPMARPRTSTLLRADDVAPSLPAARALDSAPASDDGHFVVPRIVRR